MQSKFLMTGSAGDNSYIQSSDRWPTFAFVLQIWSKLPSRSLKSLFKWKSIRNTEIEVDTRVSLEILILILTWNRIWNSTLPASTTAGFWAVPAITCLLILGSTPYPPHGHLELFPIPSMAADRVSGQEGFIVDDTRRAEYLVDRSPDRRGEEGVSLL